ncbi:OB-fold protein [Spongiimicrobium salis]|uniref:OB-fold protein n=1 Tax=Spongiimicrobium salis TaxID=1667022 RepID=UPI00374D9944
MKKKKIAILGTILVVLAIGGFVYNYTFNSKHRDIANEEATATLSAKELFANFQNNESLATTNYLDNVIEINGNITNVEEDEVVLNDQIQVRFNAGAMSEVKEGVITIKGRCVGYDELLEMVKIDQATVINK